MTISKIMITKTSMTREDILNVLRTESELQDLPQADLDWLIDHAEIQEIEAGEFIFSPGSPADHFVVVLSGQFRVYFERNGQRQEFSEFGAGALSGVLPYSRMKVANGYGEAKVASSVLRLHRDHFSEMICYHHALTELLVHQMTARVRAFTTMQQQNDKLASLGKLSAGLAHELNNPAAAVVRSSDALKKHLQAVPDKFKKIMHIKIGDEEVDVVNAVMFRRLEHGGKFAKTLMERTALEDELADWMADRDFEHAYEWAEALAEFDFSINDLAEINAVVPDKNLSPLIGWIVSNLITEKMVSEIGDASKRISELVKSVKDYTHMDRSIDKQPTDMLAGIRSTITMLGHKVRANKVRIQEEIPPGLPLVPAFPGEVNQVFTNIIDNALDAMETTGGTLTIKARQDGDFVKIDINDTGTGIPEDILQNVFDPFFTTKEIGKGTGMGLDVVRQIMTQRHRGSVKVESSPGQTTFFLCFPLL